MTLWSGFVTIPDDVCAVLFFFPEGFWSFFVEVDVVGSLSWSRFSRMTKAQELLRSSLSFFGGWMVKLNTGECLYGKDELRYRKMVIGFLEFGLVAWAKKK